MIKTLQRNLLIAASSFITFGTLLASPAKAITLLFSGAPQNTWQVSLSYDENSITYSTFDGVTTGTTQATNLTINGYIGSYDNSDDYGFWNWSNVGDTIYFHKNDFSDPLEPLGINLVVYPPVPPDANIDAQAGETGLLSLHLETLGNVNKGWIIFEDGWFTTAGYTFGGTPLDYKVPLGASSTSPNSIPEPSTTASLLLLGLFSGRKFFLKKTVERKS